MAQAKASADIIHLLVKETLSKDEVKLVYNELLKPTKIINEAKEYDNDTKTIVHNAYRSVSYIQ